MSRPSYLAVTSVVFCMLICSACLYFLWEDRKTTQGQYEALERHLTQIYGEMRQLRAENEMLRTEFVNLDMFISTAMNSSIMQNITPLDKTAIFKPAPKETAPEPEVKSEPEEQSAEPAEPLKTQDIKTGWNKLVKVSFGG